MADRYGTGRAAPTRKPGVLLAVRGVARLPEPLTLGLESLLF